MLLPQRVPAPITIISYSSVNYKSCFSPIPQDGCVLVGRPNLVGLFLERLELTGNPQVYPNQSIHRAAFSHLPAWSMGHLQASPPDNEIQCCDRKHRLVQMIFNNKS